MRHLYSSIDGSNLIDSLDLRTKSSMHTKNFAINDNSDGQVVKNFSTIFPRIRISVLSIDLIIKSIDCCDLSN